MVYVHKCKAFVKFEQIKLYSNWSANTEKKWPNLVFVNKESSECASPNATRNGEKIDLEKHQEASKKRKQSGKRKVALGFSTLVKSSKEAGRGVKMLI